MSNAHPAKPFPLSSGNGAHPRLSTAYQQLIAMQRLALDASKRAAADAVDCSLDPEQRARASTALSNVMKAWDNLEARKRVLRGLGNPKAVEARNAKPKRKPTKHELMTSEDMPAADQTESGEGIS